MLKGVVGFGSSGEVVDKWRLRTEMVGKWSIKPSLAARMVDILLYVVDNGEVRTEAVVSHFGIPSTTAKRYLRQLTKMGYLEALGGNRNRTYRKHT